MNQTALSLRVFKRSAHGLVLLWNRIEGASPESAVITFKPLYGKGPAITASSPVIDEPIKASKVVGDFSVSDNTVVCVVSEKDEGLDSKTPYYVQVSYGDRRESIRLTPAGTYPSHEKEDRKKNVHLMAWDEEKSVWRKVNGVKGPDNQFYLGVAMAQCPKCGHEA